MIAWLIRFFAYITLLPGRWVKHCDQPVWLSVFMYVCMSVCMFVSLSVCLSLCLFVCLFVCLFWTILFFEWLIAWFVFAFITLPPGRWVKYCDQHVCLSLCMYVCMSVCLSVCMSVCLLVCLYVCLSFCISRPHDQTLSNFMYMLGLIVAVDRSFCDDNTIRHMYSRFCE